MLDICLSDLPSHRILANTDDIIICIVTFGEHVSALISVFGELSEELDFCGL